MNEEYTGVENAQVAAEQDQTVDTYQDEGYFPDSEEPETENETGVESEPAVAGQEEEVTDDRVEKAFAKRLAQEREKIKKEFEEEFNRKFYETLQQYQMQYQYSTPYTQPQTSQQPSIDEMAEQLANDLMITPEAAKKMLMQEQQLQSLYTELYLMKDNTEKVRAQQTVEERRRQNPYLPPFDEKKVASYRLKYYNKYGVLPSWEDAYDYYVAEAAKSGELLRMAEQKAVQQIASKNRANVQIGRSAQPQKKDIWSLSQEEFERMIELAKQGQLKEL